MHSYALIALAAAPLIAAQGPGDGVAKTTYACYDVKPGLEFMLKYLPTTAAIDSCDGNYCGYSAQGRCQLVEPGYFTEKNCALYSAVGGTSAATSIAAITAPDAQGDDCTYQVGYSFDSADAELMWETFAHSGDTCCKACATTAGCVASQYDYSTTGGEYERRRLQPRASEGFGLHLVDVFSSATTGGLTVYDLEQKFAERLGDLSAFDAFMDYNAALFTTALGSYADKFAADGVPTLAASWTADTGATWYSLFVHVPESQMVLELVGTESPLAAARAANATAAEVAAADAALVTLEARVSPRNVAKFDEYEADDLGLLYAVSVSRAVSDITAIERFYETELNFTVVHSLDDADGTGVSRRCYGWEYAESDVCFVERPDPSGAAFGAAELEAMLWSVHTATLLAPSNTNKYTDNHYAVDSMESKTFLTTYFTSNDPYPITNSSREAYNCNQQGFVMDPTGWSIQVDLSGSTSFPSCSRSEEKEEEKNHFLEDGAVVA